MQGMYPLPAGGTLGFPQPPPTPGFLCASVYTFRRFGACVTDQFPRDDLLALCTSSPHTYLPRPAYGTLSSYTFPLCVLSLFTLSNLSSIG